MCNVSAIEISASSPVSFDHAMRIGLNAARQALPEITGAWISKSLMEPKADETLEYTVAMWLTYDGSARASSFPA